jgi:hypothetical protein
MKLRRENGLGRISEEKLFFYFWKLFYVHHDDILRDEANDTMTGKDDRVDTLEDRQDE